ncbi:hypothetical protein UT300007_13370 [Clostridium sp. CTA-7]
MIMIENFLKDIEEWAKGDLHIESVIIVGSYARGTNKNTSDIDLCIITSNKETMIKNQDFTKIFGNIDKKQTEYYGKCTSIRVWYKEGREIEFGIVDPSWIESPLDAGTYKVLSDGYKVSIDKKHYFSNLEISKS